MNANGSSRGYSGLLPAPTGSADWRNGQTVGTPFEPGLVPVLPSAASANGTKPINWRAVLGAFKRRWFLALLLGTCLGAAGAAAAWRFVPAPYEAFSELQISSVKDKLLFETKEARANFDIYKQTQMRMVTSPLVINAAAREGKLQELPSLREEERPLSWLEENLSVSSPATEFIRISLTGEHPEELAQIVNAVTDAFVREVVDREEAGRRVRLDQLETIQTKQEEILRGKRAAFKTLAEQSTSVGPETAGEKQKFLFEMQVQYRKELAQVYFLLLDAQLELQSLPTDDELSSAPPPTETPKEEDETPIAEEFDITIPESVVDAMVRDNQEFQDAMARITQLESYVSRSSKTLAEAHPKLVKARMDLESAEAERDDLIEELRPRVIDELKRQIEVRRQEQLQQFQREASLSSTQQPQQLPTGQSVADRRAELESQVTLFEAKQKELEERINEARGEEKENVLLSFELEQHRREISEHEAMIQYIRSEIDRMKIELDSPVGVSLFRPAEVPAEPNLKKKVMATGVAGFGLLGAAVASIVLLEMRMRRIHSVDEVASDLSLRLVGTLPIMPRHATNGRSRHKSRSAFWHSMLAESVDSARTVLLRDAVLDHVHVIMIASAMGGEGKTTLSCHLATSLARAGRSVLLIDGDMRRPSVDAVFGLPGGPGFCDLLRGEADASEVIHITSPEGLAVMPAGRIDQKVLKLLAKERVDEVLHALRQSYEFIIIDSSPVLSVNDSVLLAQHVDGVLLSIRRDVSRQTKVAAACQRMSMLGVPLLGAVALGLDDEASGHHYSYSSSSDAYLHPVS